MSVNFSDELLKYNQLLGLSNEEINPKDDNPIINTDGDLVNENPKDGNELGISFDKPDEPKDNNELSLDTKDYFGAIAADEKELEDRLNELMSIVNSDSSTEDEKTKALKEIQALSPTEPNFNSAKKEINIGNNQGTTVEKSPYSLPDDINTGRSIDSTGADDEHINSIYQPLGADFSDVGEIIKRSVGFNPGESKYEKIVNNAFGEIDVFDPNAKVENSITSNDLQFFLYNNVPYILGSAANMIGGIVDSVQSIVDSPENLVKQIGTVRQALDTAHKVTYYTPQEGLKLLGQTFITLQLLPFMKGISVKFDRMNLKSIKAEEFGDQNARELLDGPRPAGLQAGEGFNSFKEMFDSVIGKVTSAIKNIFNKDESEVQDNVAWLQSFEKEFLDIRKDMEDAIIAQNIKALSPADYLKYYEKNPSKEGNSSGDSSTAGTVGRLDLSSILDKRFDNDKASEILSIIKENNYDYYEGHLENNDTTYLGFLSRIKDDSKNSWTEFTQRVSSIFESNKASYIHDIIQQRDVDNYIDQIEENDTIYLDKLEDIKGQTKNAWNTLNQKIQTISEFKNIHSIGYIMVYPTLQDGGIPNAFKIPLQFNPRISESGKAARYETQQLLHRQGNIFSYVGTEGQTLTLETEYFMTTDGKPNERNEDVNWNVEIGPQDAWYSFWTPVSVQAIERALRSIVLPQVSGDGDTDIKFHKPPMVKVVFGNGDSNTPTPTPMGTSGSYNLHPMLTYPITSGNDIKYYHRTYLVTKVIILKDTSENPLHLDDSGNLMDTHGFKVSLELSEVDSNYIGILPNFGDYYNSYKGQGEDAYKNA